MSYVNQGPDPRARGAVGAALAWMQRTLSFHSETAPHSWVARWGSPRWKVGIEWSRPRLLPFVLVFIPRSRSYGDLVNGARQRWWSFRTGWRWDQNWGRGGYIADVIVKTRIDNLVE